MPSSAIAFGIVIRPVTGLISTECRSILVREVRFCAFFPDLQVNAPDHPTKNHWISHKTVDQSGGPVLNSAI